MTTVMVVDDHSVVRMGLITLLSRTPDLQVVAEAGSAAEAVTGALAARPDLVLMDVRLPDGSGIECCRAILAQLPATRVLMLTSYDDQDAMVAAIMAGAAGYLLKQVEPEQLLRSIRLAAEGHCLLDPSLTRQAIDRVRQEAAVESELTNRERTILALVGEGLTNREIAGRLYLSEKTVRNGVSIILSKLGLTNRTQAAMYVSRMQKP